MNYVVETAENAFRRLVGLSPVLISQVEEALQRLAEDPLRLGRKAVFPFPPRGNLYSFHCVFEGVRYDFRAFYFFKDDERTLLIHDVTVISPNYS